jgi:FkbM family methyltransferase
VIEGNINHPKISFILERGFNWIKELKTVKSAKFFALDTGDLRVDVDSLSFIIESEEELFIIKEIFIDNSYGFQFPSEFIFVDVGMNIGCTSLYFSSNVNVKRIYGFEPVPETYSRLLDNLKINETANKIVPFNFGLGKSNRTETFLFSRDFKGSVGINELSDVKKRNSRNLSEVAVEIRKASDVFNNIIQENPTEKIVLKIDCEGGEYDIIEDLRENQILKKIDVIMIEWHVRGYEVLLSHLNEFICFHYNISPETGMIYCVRAKL